MQQSLYDQELYAWAMQTARMVREKRFDELDVEHLAEELESIGKSELRALESRLTVLLAHLLKWQYQSPNRSKSWQRTLIERRKRSHRLSADSPSLQPKPPAQAPRRSTQRLQRPAPGRGGDGNGFRCAPSGLRSCPTAIPNHHDGSI